MIKTYLPAGAAGAGAAGAAGAAGTAAGASAGFGASAFLQPATVRAKATISNNERIKAITFFTCVTSSLI
jgi:sugar (pentulose or hexulose) kinase